MTDKQVSMDQESEYINIDGYRHINILVRWPLDDKRGVELSVIFAFDSKGDMMSRNYVTLEENIPARFVRGRRQGVLTNYITVDGSDSWFKGVSIGTYLVRLPVMGPYIKVIVNRGFDRRITVWGYLVS